MSVPDLHPFLVVPRKRGEVAPLLEFMKVAAAQHPETVFVERTVGGTAAPTRLVVRATLEAIQALESRYGGELLIEPDQSLKMS